MLKKLFYLITLYIVSILFNEYPFGESAHQQDLTYIQSLIKPALYPLDFYVQRISQYSPNERYFFVNFMQLTGQYLEIFCFIFHFICSLSLFYGLFHIAKRYIYAEYLIWLCLFFMFSFLSRFHFGGYDLFNNQLLSVSFSTAFGIWALYYFLEEKYYYFSVLAILASLLHPIAGTQIFILCVGAYFLNDFFEHKKIDFFKNKPFFHSMLLFFGVAFIPLGLLFQYLNHSNSSAVSADLFYEIIAFRVPHHFIPSYYRWYNYVVMIPLFLFGLYFFRKKDAIIFYAFVTCLSALIIYTFAVEVIKSPALFFTQWCRSTTWLKPLAVFGIVALIENTLIKKYNWSSFFQKLTMPFFLFSFFFTIAMLAYPQGWFQKQSYNLPFTNYKKKPSIDIGLKCKNLLPNNVLFVEPAQSVSVRYFGEKSGFVDLQAIVHRKEEFNEWYKRVQKLYKLNISNRDYSKSIFQQADDNYYQLREADFQKLHDEDGVTHILTTKDHSLNFPIVVENEAFVVFKINSK